MPLDQTEESQFPYEKNMGFFDHIDELRARLYRLQFWFYWEPYWHSFLLNPFLIMSF